MQDIVILGNYACVNIATFVHNLCLFFISEAKKMIFTQHIYSIYQSEIEI